MTPQERGRLGGKATVARYGVGHMREIGKAGFRTLAQRYGSRQIALRKLASKGKLTLFHPDGPDLTEAETCALDEAVGLPN